jgi:ornithine decarboxylase
MDSYNISDIISFLKDKDIKMVDESVNVIDIIRSFLDETDSEEAFFIVDLTKIIEQYNKWVTLLPDIMPYYAMKCNPNDVIISLLDKLGTNFDCASKNEIAQILNHGIDPNRIIFANPNRQNSYIKYARSNDVDLLTVDSVTEMYKLIVHHPGANLLIRIKVDDSKSECKFSCKFGASVEEADELCKVAKMIKLNIVGVAFHIGSNCRDANMYYDAIKNARDVFDIGRNYGFDMNYLDIGGGFPGFHQEGEHEFEDYANIIKKSISELFPPEYIDPLTFKQISELGRYFVASSHTLVLSVINKKERIEESTGKKYFIYYLNDGTYHSFGNIMFDHAKPKLLPYNERDGKLYEAIVYGQTCDSIDKIAPICSTKPCMLPDLACGEFVYAENMGAYTSASSSTFNSFPHTKCKYILRTQSL